ncbi:MAG: L-seryl-tRNA(Sec) selenium transferase [Armatimonadetes bacterium]|nr:L-seryl-tRNA(Sec) selenium transferase [Armatimonadota bacterium]
MADPAFRQLPSVDRVLRDPRLAGLLARYGRSRVVAAIRQALNRARERLAAGEFGLAEDLAGAVTAALAPEPLRLSPAINASGVILNTGLGRAVLSESACRALFDAAGRHVPLEVDLGTGERGDRQLTVRSLLCRLCGSESALVVNNNAAALFLALTALASGREVVISRGELVEIGGSFRLPDILSQAGARLVEVGATNRTRLSDYERALSAETALILAVHPSNYRIVGYTASVEIEALAALGRQAGVPVIYDLGSGALVDFAALGVPGASEPQPGGAIASGASLVAFSGDKLLGGPQAGILAGDAACIERLARHPVARVVRADKLALAALEATLQLYLEGRAETEVPTLAAILRPAAAIKAQAERVAAALRSSVPEGASVRVVTSVSQVGGGSFPDAGLPSWAVAVRPLSGSAARLAGRLRSGRPAVFGRVAKGDVLLDMRCVADAEEAELMERLVAACGEETSDG